MRRSRLGSFAGIALVAILVTGCSAFTSPYQLRTASAPQEVCLLALAAGSLERHPLTGLGIAWSDVEVKPVEWGFGYSARVEGVAVVLVDPTGKVVARELDRVEVGGGEGPDGMWHACGGVTFVDNLGG